MTNSAGDANEKESTHPNNETLDKVFIKPQEILKGGIVKSVAFTNNVLSKLEQTNHQISQDFTSRVLPLYRQIRFNAQRALAVYERRQQYGPQIVAGSTAAATLLVSLRRGRVPGVALGALTGLGSYSAVYGMPGPK